MDFFLIKPIIEKKDYLFYNAIIFTIKQSLFKIF
jgi:hypothetical protein|nr:MAG TPA: hypothetical protein [Caudoviricetes sp.]